jgi:hypothetical protein
LISKGADCTRSPGTVFDERIAPLLTADRPNVCAQCHAGGSIDLQAFLRPDVCESMACLKAQGLVDLEHPERSVLLSWISRAQPNGDAASGWGGAGGSGPGEAPFAEGAGPKSPLITQDIIDQERLGFLEWFQHEAACRSCDDAVCPNITESSCGSAAALEKTYQAKNDPGDCERETLERLFRGTIYEWRGRCYPCHFQGTKGSPDAPRWASDVGTCEVAALATQQNIVDSGYVNSRDPKKSLLILKPLAEADGGVPHGGHDKFTLEDPAYADFLYWTQRYSACQNASVGAP